MAATSTSNPISRLLNINTSGEKGGRNLPLWRQLLLQVVCLIIAAEVLFPIMYVVTLSLSSKTTRPSSLELFPKEFSLVAFQQVLDHPTANPVSFAELLRNSFFLSFGVGALALLVAGTAAYAFSRFKFKGRQFLMVLVFVPLLMPGVGLSTPLYLLMNSIRVMNCGDSVAIVPFFQCATGAGKLIFNLRDSLMGVGIAMTAGALPFAVWNLKGYLDTIPKELEEAALIDGADFNRVFFQIVLPLATPQLAVTFFLGFIGHWQEFALSWLFLSKPQDYTLSMTLYNMTGQYAQNIPWNRFSAMAIIVALPVAVIYFAL
ncbi:MAG: ABC transporter permease subunit, partial [Chloroflexota bacterium]